MGPRSCQAIIPNCSGALTVTFSRALLQIFSSLPKLPILLPSSVSAHGIASHYSDKREANRRPVQPPTTNQLYPPLWICAHPLCLPFFNYRQLLTFLGPANLSSCVPSDILSHTPRDITPEILSSFSYCINVSFFSGSAHQPRNVLIFFFILKIKILLVTLLILLLLHFFFFTTVFKHIVYTHCSQFFSTCPS